MSASFRLRRQLPVYIWRIYLWIHVRPNIRSTRDERQQTNWGRGAEEHMDEVQVSSDELPETFLAEDALIEIQTLDKIEMS